MGSRASGRGEIPYSEYRQLFQVLFENKQRNEVVFGVLIVIKRVVFSFFNMRKVAACLHADGNKPIKRKEIINSEQR